MSRKGQSYTVPFYNPHPTPPTYVPNRYPTKPPFAYGFGDKPKVGQESPIFRHILSTSPPGPEKRSTEAWQPFTRETKSLPPFKRGVFKPKPAEDYYATYRNASRSKPSSWNHQAEAPILGEDFTQGDSSSSNGRHQNVISNAVVEDKKRKLILSKHPKPLEVGIPISKRVDESVKNKVPNGRLKYSLDGKDSDEVYVNASGRYTPAPLTINVLPDSGKSKLHINKKKDGR